MKTNIERVRYTASNITQGKTRFYTLSMPTEMLVKCCFVSTRDENPKDGFQRILDERRALEIAKYIDEDKGTIPSAIILSAQKSADVNIVGRGRTIEFTPDPNAFLILDGQHRVYGFSKSQTSLRVPVVIYVGLDRRQESRLFIDINSKQKGVPTELLLDIKKMAEYESAPEQLLRSIFDLFDTNPDSALYGALSPSSKASGKISRVTFNTAIKPITRFFGDKEPEEIYEILNSYLKAFQYGFFKQNSIEDKLVTPTVFRAVFSVWPEVGSKVKDKFGAEYNIDSYSDVMTEMYTKLKVSQFKKPGSSYKSLAKHLSESLHSVFSL